MRALLVLSVVLAPLCVLLSPSEAHAYAWMLKHGYSGCPVCHADPSGGELLTTYGRAQSAFFLSMRWKKEPQAEKPKEEGGASSGGDFDSFDSFGDDTSDSSAGDDAAAPEEKPKKKKKKKKKKPADEPEADAETEDEDPQEMKGKQAGKKIVPEKINLDEEEPEEKPKPKTKAKPPAKEEEAEPDEEEEKPKAKPKAVAAPKAKAEPEEDEDKAEALDKAEGDKASEGEEEEEDEDADTKAAASDEAEAEAAPAELEEPTMFSDFLFGLVRLPPALLLGATYRHMNIISPSSAEVFRTFPMQMDLYGQLQLGIFRANASIGASKVPAGSPFARPAQITTGQGDQWNLISRVHWLGVDLANNLVTVRAGRMNLPFGVRIPEHTMWVRQRTRTDRESGQQHGVAASYNGELLRGEFMVIAGNYQINPDEFRERGYSAYAEYLVTPKTAVGLSSLITSAGNDRIDPEGESTLRQVHGPMLRTVLSEKVVVLGEADLMLKSRSSLGYVGFAQVDYEPIQGLHFMVTGEILDQGFPESETLRVPGSGKPKVGGWLTADWFFLPHFEMRVDAVMRQTEPFTLLAQLHVYL